MYIIQYTLFVLQVEVKSEKGTESLLQEKLHSRIKPEESVWSFHKGECIQVGACTTRVYVCTCS